MSAVVGPSCIVFLAPIGEIGGAERVLLDMLASMRTAAPSLRLHVIVGTEGPLIERVTEAGAESTLLPMPQALAGVGDSALIGARPSRLRLAWRGLRASTAAVRYAARLHRLVRRLGPDIIHSNGNKFHLVSRLALGRRWPVIWHLHDFLSERPLMSRLVRRASGEARGAIAISEAVAHDARKLLGPFPIEVVHNAIDTDRFSPGPGDGERLDRLARLAPTSGVVRVGLVATYARWKGQDVLLEAIARLPRDLRARFYIVGGPIYQTAGSQFTEEELRQRIKQLEHYHRVGLVGFQDDTPAVYRALEVVVHASTRPEPFGLTIVEAMACGRAVIVAAAGGAAELVTPEVDALAITPGDAAGLANAIRRLVSDADLRRRLGEAARRTALARFHRDRLGGQLLAAYRRFLS